MDMTVYSKFQVAGFHFWPEAPDNLDFLRNVHRHMFYVEVHCTVNHSNREVEIITLKHTAKAALILLALANYNEALYFGSRSCEMLAMELGDLLRKQGLHVMLVDISEDNENGGYVTYEY